MNEWAMQGFRIHVGNAMWSTQHGSRWSLAAVWPLLREFMLLRRMEGLKFCTCVNTCINDMQLSN